MKTRSTALRPEEFAPTTFLMERSPVGPPLRNGEGSAEDTRYTEHLPRFWEAEHCSQEAEFAVNESPSFFAGRYDPLLHPTKPGKYNP